MKMRRITAVAPNPNATGNNDSLVYVTHDAAEQQYQDHPLLARARREMLRLEMEQHGVEAADIKWDEATFELEEL